jgi:hypothetical protein
MRSTKVIQEQLTEMKNQYEAEYRPYIEVELIYEKRAFYGLRFVNHGRKIANHVRFELSQNFLEHLSKSESFKSRLEAQQNRQCVIGVGQHYDLFFGSNECRSNPDYLLIDGKVTYDNGNNKYEDNFSIDFSNYATFFDFKSDFEELNGNITEQNMILNRIAESIKK